MLEQVLERIAVALEKIAGTGTPMVNGQPAAQAAKKQRVAPAAPVDVIPGDVLPGDDVPGAEATVLLCRGVTDTAALRDFTQKALTAAGAKANDLVTFIKGEVCAKFTPKEPKLIKIPQANVAAAAQMIYDWCFKNNIILEG